MIVRIIGIGHLGCGHDIVGLGKRHVRISAIVGDGLLNIRRLRNFQRIPAGQVRKLGIFRRSLTALIIAGFGLFDCLLILIGGLLRGGIVLIGKNTVGGLNAILGV